MVGTATSIQITGIDSKGQAAESLTIGLANSTSLQTTQAGDLPTIRKTVYNGSGEFRSRSRALGSG